MTRKLLRPRKKQSALIRDPELRRRKREEVAAAAFDLFLQEGFHRTTTRAIAQRAGVSAGAVFTYFEDKAEILFHIVSKEQGRGEAQLLEILRQQIAKASRTSADPEEVFVNVFATFLRAIDDLRRFILLAYQETKSLNTEARQALIAREKRIQTLLSEAIDYGVEQGRFAPEHIELKAHTLMVLAHAWATRHWAFAGVMPSIEDYIAFLQPLVLAMLEKRAAVERPKKEEQQQPAVDGRAIWNSSVPK